MSADFPAPLTHTLDRYRDVCRRGGDSVPDRVAHEQAIRDHCAAMVSAALDRAMPVAPSDDELAQWLDGAIRDADRATDAYVAGYGDAASDRGSAEFWAREARILRTLRERVYPRAVGVGHV